MERAIRIFPTPYDVAEKFAEEMVEMIKESEGKPFTIVLSGGSTPELLFSLLGDHFTNAISWASVHFFWGDERCVAPDNSESNFGMAKRTFFDKIKIPSSNIHRIRGEEDPGQEALRYSNEIKEYTLNVNGLPAFDLVILGLGDDGHTASIFPGHLDMLQSDIICDVAVHPISGQRRVTITGRVINNARMVTFLVTGKNKAVIVDKIINDKASAVNYPALYIEPVNGNLKWFIDKEAAALLKSRDSFQKS